MIVYLLPLSICLIGANLFEFQNRKSILRNFLWGFLWIYMILLIGFRYKVGGDTIVYMGDYQWRSDLSGWSLNFIDKYQPGYTLLCAIAKSIGPDFYILQLLHATIFNTLLFYFIRRNTRYIFASFISIFFCCYLYFATEVLREVLSVMVFVLNYNNLKYRHWLKYYLGVLLAVFFHISAIFLVILPFLSKLRINRAYLFILSMLLFILFFSQNLLAMISNLPIFLGKIDTYKSATSTGLLSDLLNLSRYCLLPIGFGYIVKNIAKKDLKFENIIAILGLVGLASYFNYIIFGRLINYLILFFAISIVDFCIPSIKSINRVICQYGWTLTVAFFLLFGSQFILYKRYTRWIPYYSIFNPVEVNRDNYGDL